MSITSTIDRSGVRWTKFNSVYTRVTGAITKNAAHHLSKIVDSGIVNSGNVCEYLKLDLDHDHLIKNEQRTSNYINDAGLLEYLNYNNDQAEIIDGILKELHLTLPSNESDIIVYRDTVILHENENRFKCTFFMINVLGKIWIEAVKLCRFIGYVDPWHAIAIHITDSNKCKYSEAWPTGVYRKRIGNLIFINKQGVAELFRGMRRPYDNSKVIAIIEKLQLQLIIKDDVLRKKNEQQCISDLMRAFRGVYTCTAEYAIDRFRIDLYIHEPNIAIECDSNDHKSYDPIEEVSRQMYIENTLGCDFVRFNPDSEHFSIMDVIARIHIVIKNKRLMRLKRTRENIENICNNKRFKY